ncbi:MAG: DUF4189 domain-containing protein [Thermodesulfobacteriota bacterium]
MRTLAAAVACIGILAVLLSVGETVSADNYGAIAYSSSTGRYGYSYDYGSRGDAESAAVTNCARSDCQVKVWFRNSCGALARAGNGALGYGFGFADRSGAESRALAECGARGSSCRIVSWACTTR